MLYQLSYQRTSLNLNSGRSGWIRTIDPAIMSGALYQLSYRPIMAGELGFEPRNSGLESDGLSQLSLFPQKKNPRFLARAGNVELLLCSDGILTFAHDLPHPLPANLYGRCWFQCPSHNVAKVTWLFGSNQGVLHLIYVIRGAQDRPSLSAQCI
jgi:hypothetical protein